MVYSFKFKLETILNLFRGKEIVPHPIPRGYSQPHRISILKRVRSRVIIRYMEKGPLPHQTKVCYRA